MTKVKDWITMIAAIVVIVGTILGGIMFFATKDEMNRRFDEARNERNRIESRLEKLEHKMDKLTDHFIEHLRDHNRESKGD